jgi:hypothetical protein
MIKLSQKLTERRNTRTSPQNLELLLRDPCHQGGFVLVQTSV